MEQKNQQIIIRPEFEMLKKQLTIINNTACQIQNRQKKIIETANSVNNSLKKSIEEDIADTKLMEQTDERIKNLQTRVDNSKQLLSNIRDKLNKLKEIRKKIKYQKENIFNL